MTCFSCNTTQGLVSNFKLDPDLELCGNCTQDPYKFNKAMQTSNLMTFIHVQTQAKLAAMREFYFASLALQNSAWGAGLLKKIAECGLLIGTSTAKLHTLRNER